MPRDVYAEAEAELRKRLLDRPQARGRGKSPEFIDKAVRVGIWLLRKHHGPYGRIFSACREVFRRAFGCCCRAVIDALRQVGLLQFLPRANGHERKFRSPEYAAFQFELGPDFALFFSAANSETRLAGEEKNLSSLPISGAIVPARTWDRARPEFRLAIRRAAKAALVALQARAAEPLPRLSPLALAALRRTWRL
jgi:putative component of toxin-antitoxin plasmid stabilization module